MEKANITLYTVIGDPGRIETAIREHFKEMTKEFTPENGNILLTLADDSTISFNINHRQDKPDFIASHTAGMANYFSSAETPLVELKENVLQQIRVFNCVTGITFDIDDNGDRTSYIINGLFAIANDVNGFLLYPSMQIYTQEGKLLFSIKGESQLTEFMPIANADLLDGNRPQESPADMKRRLRSNALLKARNIPYMEQLPCEVLESEVQMRSREKMVERAAALFAVAVYSEVILSEDSDREKALFYFNKMNDLYGVKSYLTNGKPVSSSYGVMNAAPCCFGQQVLSTTSPIRPRLSMCPSWLLFSGNIKDCRTYCPKAIRVRKRKYWMKQTLHCVTTGPVWMHAFMGKKLRPESTAES